MNQNKIWDYFQNEGVHSFEGSKSRLAFLVKQFNPCDKILNIGVGGCFFERIALEKKIDVYSLDPNEKAINVLQQLVGNSKAKVGYSQSIPFENDFFDGVVMSEVLEHLSDEVLHTTISEVYRVLKVNGRFIGTVPYCENLLEQIVVCPDCGKKFHRWGHLQSFNERGLKKLLERKFLSLHVKPKMFISWKTLNWKGKVEAILKYLFFMLNVKKSGLNLYFEGQK
ncbi:class I SAM-dependent methyltransferase [Sulfurospirillum barnesii]|uniref:Methylase involved in ubiquinone/menaquinone biosynthesis n=1 Tax=Sulfurospirillum barnesii (strain ATCC 700032 / DSM 10660 / SES-3) TaxID=760154 RepID=I3XYY3_SULBS|nr:class I SAM-dependent methyltransferase [Sulfurospirillum barnesii]AFL69157.1 methylase involved in ubiquinone/menaquinone biosynthesis [Sulfurospirillum barnesii SES-3]